MNRKEFREKLQEAVLLGDGAMGTMLNEAVPDALCPEALNLNAPEVVTQVHRAYAEAGSRIIQTNTFGGNPLKLKAYGMESATRQINETAVKLARQAASEGQMIAGGIGPTGKLMEPMGELSFDEAVACFTRQAQALIDGECDLILIETLSDLQEARAAVVAVKAVDPEIAIVCTMTFDAQQRTLTGADPETVATVLEGLGVDVLGANCGVGPDVMLSIIQRMRRVTDKPLAAQANAGMPVLRKGQAVYEMTPERMAPMALQLAEAGAAIIGGCCGTNPRHIGLFREAMAGHVPKRLAKPAFSKLAGASRMISIGPGMETPVIGENINPSARKVIRQALETDQLDSIVKEAVRQQDAGASLVDVNTGAPGVNQVGLMPRVIQRIQQVVSIPVAIDSTDPEVTEAGLKAARGKPLINSANGDPELLKSMVHLAVQYGAAMLCLTLDQNGIPEKAEERVAIAERMVEAALAGGMRREDIFIDPLTLTAGAQQSLVMETIRALEMIRERLQVRTVLGISNISHGLPARKPLNAAFLSMALGAGLDLPILNPCEPSYMQLLKASDVLTGKDVNAGFYIQASGSEGTGKKPDKIRPAAISSSQELEEIILSGEKERAANLVKELALEGWTSLGIIDRIITPALARVGDEYEAGRAFLPQLLMAAESAQAVFAAIRESLPGSQDSQRFGTVVMATVKGDIHDIGKNIVAVMLENNGFRVVDLGRDVTAETILETAEKEGAAIIGLSALMTTTMQEMKTVSDLMKYRGISTPLMVGGAVLSESYARQIGAVYASDAVQAVKTAKAIVASGGSPHKPPWNA